MGPTGNIRGAQIHPSRQCNLRCQHCYSSSSPDVDEAMPISLLSSLIDDLAAENYDWVSFSGGEPLLYKSLPYALERSKAVGLNTAIATNGMLLTEERLNHIQGLVDIIAISLDGVPASHNKMRSSTKAFDTMDKRLDGLHKKNIPFGFIFTLTQYNLDELEWVVNYAIEKGARLLQVHPLSGAGYAKNGLLDAVPDAIESAYGWLLSQQIQKQLGGRLSIQVDITCSEAALSQPDSFFCSDDANSSENASLGDLLSPLIIESDGTVSPLQYGFPKAYSLGNINDNSLKELARQWKRSGKNQFDDLCRHTHSKILDREEPYFFNWYDEISRMGVA